MDGAEGGHRRSIYVEILVRGGLDEIWNLTQRPELHRRWDLRFSDIEYLPRPDEALPQRFLYTTRIGFGLAIRGWGESTGVREAGGGTRTSALRFWSADPKSLIREGSGYWRYVPVPGGVRFLTRYDYRTRFGLAGRLVDRALFRPLLGWATAWSFDRLRLWIEREIDPRASLRRGLADLAARLGLASILLGHGLASMLIDRSPGALRLLAAAGLAPGAARQALPLLGIAEAALGAALLAGRRVRARRGGDAADGCRRCRARAPLARRPARRRRGPSPAARGERRRARRPRLERGPRAAVGRALPACAGRDGGGMTSIYQEVLGADFARLHPQIQRRFGLGSADGLAAVGSGIMDEIWHGAAYTLPFLYLGSWRRIMFPERGRQVPFTIENYAFLDPYGRETVTWIRTFAIRRRRRFDAFMIHSRERRRIVDYLGTHQHLAVDLELAVDERGGLRLRSGEQRFYEGRVAFPFPLALSGVAEVCEWYDDARDCFRIEVAVRNRRWGPLFGYRGSFHVEWRTVVPGQVPAHLLPVRYERRE